MQRLLAEDDVCLVAGNGHYRWVRARTQSRRDSPEEGVMTELMSPLSGALRSAPRVPPPFEERDVITQDDTPLTARFYAPRQPARGAVLIVSAMGVPQRFYGAFASWLASRGFHVVTFDY